MRIAAILVAVALAAVACAPDPLPGYRHATTGERDALLGVIHEYFDLVDRAQVSGDIGPLYARHPALAQHEDRRQGINTEGWLVERVRRLDVREVAVDVERYERVRAFLKDDAAVVYVHGLFTWRYRTGPETKGELPIRFDLVRGSDGWTIIRTDEQVLGETPAPTPR